MRWWWLWIIVSLGGVAVAWGAWSWVADRRCRHELREADREMAGGLHQLARQRLSALIKWRPGSAEAAYQLGVCEEILGHSDAAVRAWTHIAPNDPLAAKATLGRARVLMNTGRYTPAETLLLPLSGRHGLEAEQARRALQLLFHIQGRTAEIRELILESWADSTDPAGLVRKLYLVGNSSFPISNVRTTLEAADPDDDRVWLGKAHLAAWTGQFDDASRWLARCIERRPDDEAVWRERLESARSAGDLETVQVAAQHLSLARFTPAEVLELEAWLAARRGEAELERTSLLSLVGAEPGNINAWDRLAELALLAGQEPEAEAFRRKKSEFNDLREKYKRLLERDDRAQHAHELAQLAEKLGRLAEAKGWTQIAQDRAGTEPLFPAVDRTARAVVPSATLASTFAGIFANSKTGSSGPKATHQGQAPLFVDAARAAGLHFVHDNGHSRRNPPPPEAMCGGVGLLDFDGDGSLDVYVVQAGAFPPSDSSTNLGDRLFRNRGDGTFEDVTTRAGITSFRGGYGHGVAVGDYDNDGRPDLFVTRWRSYALYHNIGSGRFEDVTSQAGLGGDRDWPTSAAFADLDGDGDLDLYVCHYLKYDPSNPRRCTHPESPSKHECNPLDFPSLPDHVFRNDGGRFVDVTAEAGVVDPDGRGLGVVAGHLDDDEKIDLYVANDMTANYLFHNLGAFRFEETGQISGAAASADGGFKAGMGIARGDLDGDGLLDMAVTNYYGESTTFYRNAGHGYFVDHSSAVNMAAPTRRLLGFGIAFFDSDNDGWLEVLSANGHVLDPRPQIPWTMPLQLLKGSPDGRLADVSELAGDPFGRLHLGRGLAVGDLDNDGRLDAIVVFQNEPLVYLHNQTKERGHFVSFSLEGTKSNRDAVGARITICAGGRRWVAERFGGGSYQSASDPRVHFGLGDAPNVNSVEIRWPSGQVERHVGLKADRRYLLREGGKPVALDDGVVGFGTGSSGK
jgi:tetratricopeptide (TPR) repeat protein